MKFSLPLAALLILTGTALANPLPPVTPIQARSHEGECVSVEGVADVQKDPLRLGTDVVVTADGTAVIGFIPAGDENQYPQLNQLTGKPVDVTGVVQFYRSSPEIKMMEPYQLLTAADFHNRRKLLGC